SGQPVTTLHPHTPREHRLPEPRGYELLSRPRLPRVPHQTRRRLRMRFLHRLIPRHSPNPPLRHSTVPGHLPIGPPTPLQILGVEMALSQNSDFPSELV